MRDQQNQLGLHEPERTRTSSDLRSLVNDVEAPIAGIEGGSDEESDQRGDRKHDEESQEPPLLRGDPPNRVLRHLFLWIRVQEQGFVMANVSFGILGFGFGTQNGGFCTFG